jgi:hypothetical protein
MEEKYKQPREPGVSKVRIPQGLRAQECVRFGGSTELAAENAKEAGAPEQAACRGQTPGGASPGPYKIVPFRRIVM